MIEIIDKNKCCGCTACASVCPKNCIKMAPDQEGFLYPIVDQDNCVNCNQCVKVCQFLNKTERHKVESSYIVHHSDPSTRNRCTSGGAFTCMAEYFIRNGGVVYGAAFDSEMVVRHRRVDTLEGISALSGSKYVQSDLGNIFQFVQKDIRSGKHVLFSGTPCQVEGLKLFLRGEEQGLVTVDFACRAVPSPLSWEKYICYSEKKYSARVVSANFRSKKYGYHNSTMELSFDNGKKYFGSVHIDYMRKAFFEGLSIRQSCTNCAVRDVNRISDITMFDCWHSKRVSCIEKDDNMGWTALLIHSNKGKELLEVSASCLDKYEVSAEQVISFDGKLITENPYVHPKRDAFFKLLQSSGIKEAVQKTVPVTFKDYLREHIKNFLFTIGVLGYISKLKGN